MFDNKKWILKSLGKNGDTVAFSDATFHSFAFGKSDWLITNDEGKVSVSKCINIKAIQI